MYYGLNVSAGFSGQIALRVANVNANKRPDNQQHPVLRGIYGASWQTDVSRFVANVSAAKYS